jgi:hypothetical protein
MQSDVMVFVSYAHGSAEHMKRVTDLVATLRAQGVGVVADTEVTTPQGPPEGWPRWMARNLEEATWVLLLFDKAYRRRWDGSEEPGKGLGATWESRIVTADLYRGAMHNKRFITLLEDGASNDLIPLELSHWTHYRIPTQAAELATKLTAAAGPAVGTVSVAEIAPTRLHHGAERLFGREQDLAALDEAWANPRTHVLSVVAWGGVGKTALVVQWMARKARDGWPGVERVYDWSFYSQGTKEQGEASAGAFVSAALRWFGDAGCADSAASAWDKGARLATLVRERPTLLVLDGMEPLQHPPSSAQPGRLKDPAIEALLKGLCQRNPGLCLVTTRERVADLAAYERSTAPVLELQHLSVPAGASLLRSLGVTGSDADLRALVVDVSGHALTLSLVGRYLAKAHGGDVRRRDRVKFDKADAKVQGGHAFKAIGAYERWLAKAGDEGKRCLAILRLLGLFDRPADPGCLAALRAEPPIPHLTEPLVGLDEEDWSLAVASLADCCLVTPLPGGGLDAHPLVREFFAARLREGEPRTWREAHCRLYEYLKGSAEYRPDTLEGLQPLFQAVAHGCQAGLHQNACDKVYWDRIQRGPECYSHKNLGAIGADLAAVSCFFGKPWTRLAPDLSESDQAWLLNEAAFSLRALGRVIEAVEPMRVGLDMRVAQKDWTNAAVCASNLCELELTHGDVTSAVREARRAVEFADRSGDAFQRMSKRSRLAHAEHEAGHGTEASELFREAEALQAELQPEYPLLYSLQGFQYCDLLLADSERSAWRASPQPALDARAREVERRAGQTLAWVTGQRWLLDIALDHLTLGRASLFRALLGDEHDEAIRTARDDVNAAVDGLRRAGQQDYLPRGLLTRAWLLAVTRDLDGAATDLGEAQEIAERGPMGLFLADVHLYRGRLFRDRAELSKAREAIDRLGYHRRDGELADAEEESKAWPDPPQLAKAPADTGAPA